MRAKMISAVLAAMLLATASVGVTASAEETTEITSVTDETHGDDADSAEDTPAAVETSSVSEEDADDPDTFREVMSELAEAGTTESAPDYYGDPYYDTDGNATLITSERIIYNTEEMQFIAVTTKDGHVFYVLINYSAADGQDNVYFLNRVDDYDLYALLYAGEEDEDGNASFTPAEAAQAAEAANGRVQHDSNADTAVTDDSAESDETPVEDAEQPKTNTMNMGSVYLVFGVIALIGIGAAGFMLTKKKSKGSAVGSVESEYEDDGEIVEDDEDDMNFYDHQEDEE